MTKTPTKLTELVSLLLDHGWKFQVIPGENTGGDPYITVEALKGDLPRITATWHTVNTGTYRLFSCLVGKKDSTLTQAMDIVRTR